MKWFHKIVAMLLGKNLKSTPADVIVDQMNEPRPLPMGRQAFDEWAERIIGGALVIPDKALCKDIDAAYESQKFALASMIMHLGPTESHKPDAYFIHSLRKGAVNQVAHCVMEETRNKIKAQKAAEEALKAKADEEEAESDDPIVMEHSSTVN